MREGEARTGWAVQVWGEERGNLAQRVVRRKRAERSGGYVLLARWNRATTRGQGRRGRGGRRVPSFYCLRLLLRPPLEGKVRGVGLLGSLGGGGEPMSSGWFVWDEKGGREELERNTSRQGSPHGECEARALRHLLHRVQIRH